jgi:hypothetical protein
LRLFSELSTGSKAFSSELNRARHLNTRQHIRRARRAASHMSIEGAHLLVGKLTVQIRVDFRLPRLTHHSVFLCAFSPTCPLDGSGTGLGQRKRGTIADEFWHSQFKTWPPDFLFHQLRNDSCGGNKTLSDRLFAMNSGTVDNQPETGPSRRTTMFSWENGHRAGF